MLSNYAQQRDKSKEQKTNTPYRLKEKEIAESDVTGNFITDLSSENIILRKAIYTQDVKI